MTLLEDLATDLERPLVEVMPRGEITSPAPLVDLAEPGQMDTLPALIRRHATQPARVAIVAPAAALTYAELWQRGCAWAREVARAETRGGAAVPVAISAHRHPDTIVAMLACFIAGTPFLPINPSLPTPYVESLLD